MELGSGMHSVPEFLACMNSHQGDTWNFTLLKLSFDVSPSDLGL